VDEWCTSIHSSTFHLYLSRFWHILHPAYHTESAYVEWSPEVEECQPLPSIFNIAGWNSSVPDDALLAAQQGLTRRSRSTAQPECLLVVYKYTRTHSPHPHSWPYTVAHSLPVYPYTIAVHTSPCHPCRVHRHF